MAGHLIELIISFKVQVFNKACMPFMADFSFLCKLYLHNFWLATCVANHNTIVASMCRRQGPEY